MKVESTDVVDRRSTRHRVVTVVAPLLTIAIALVVPLVVAYHRGALNIPRSDDWSYLRTLFRWSDTGRWDFNGWVSMTLVGQIVATRPIVVIFGTSIAAVHIFVAITGTAVLLSVPRLARRLGATPHGAWLIPLCLAASPLWGSLANTYMTDVPSFALQWLAIVAANRAFRHDRLDHRWLFSSIAIAIWAVAIRQYAGVTLIAIMTVAVIVARRTDRQASRMYVYSLAAFAVLSCTILLRLTGSIPHPQSLLPQRPTILTVRDAAIAGTNYLRVIGLALLPLILYKQPRAIVARAYSVSRKATTVVLWTSTAMMIGMYFLRRKRPFVGNYLVREGTLANDVIHGGRPNIIPTWAFEMLVIAGSVGGILLLISGVPTFVAARHSLRDRRISSFEPIIAILGLTLLGLFAAHTAAALITYPVFDRYTLPCIPIVGVLLARARLRTDTSGTSATRLAQPGAAHRRSRRASIVCNVSASCIMAGLIALGVIYTDESAAFDATRWHVAKQLTHTGYIVADIDSGYEWVGFRIGHVPPYRVAFRSRTYRRAVKAAYFDGLCVTVVVNQPIGHRQVVGEAFANNLIGTREHIYAYRDPKKQCAHEHRAQGSR